MSSPALDTAAPRETAGARPPRPSGSRGRLLGGGSLLAVAMLAANAGNYVLNLFLARVLTPAEFADANLMVTFLFALTAVALCLQLVTARFVARTDERGWAGESDRLADRLKRGALLTGVAVGLVLAAASPGWSSLFRTASPWPFVVLGAGIPFWLVQAVGRGVLQARLQLPALAGSYVVEAVTRTGLGILLVTLGLGGNGATTALTLSFVVTCSVVTLASRARGGPTGTPVDGVEVRSYAALVSVLLLGQVVANNSDVFVAKASFAPHAAAEYAVVALVGRAVFFLSWSVVTTLFPVVARRQAAGQDSGAVVRAGVLAVLGIGGACATAALWLGDPVLALVLGPAYDDLSVPVAAYASVTTLFAVGNFVASCRLSASRVAESWLLLGAAVLQVGLMLARHDDRADLIAMQAVATVALVLALGALALSRSFTPSRRSPERTTT